MKALAALVLLAACGDDLADQPDAAVRPCTVPLSHATIQAALDDAGCPSVWIEEGVYDENVTIARDVFIEGIGEVVIDGGARGSVVIIASTGIDDPVEVKLIGLVIQNGLAERGGGIASESPDDLVLDHTTVRDNRATQGGGGIDSVDDVWLRTGSAVERNRVIAEEGGGVGGGIRAKSVRMVDGSRVSDNLVEASATSSTTAVGAAGGGIAARVTLIDGGSQVTGNQVIARDGGAGATALGGGIYCHGALYDPSGVSLHGGSSVASNEASATGEAAVAAGGGIKTIDCQVTVEGSAARSNASTAGPGAAGRAAGGGIDATIDGRDKSDVRITDSEVSGNQTSAEEDAHGGGISQVVGDLVLVNSTVSGNRAAGTSATGGGISVSGIDLDLNPAQVDLHSCTLVENQAGRRGGGIAIDGALTATGAIVRGNAAPRAPDLACAGEAISRGCNLWGRLGGCTALGGDTDLDQVGVDPLLGPLGDNGGATRTHLPMPGSAVIEGGDPAGCRGPAGLLTSDQRGLPRPVGICDIGAVEVQP